MKRSWTLWLVLSLAALMGSVAMAADRGYFGFAVTVDMDSIALNPTLRTIKVDEVQAGSPAAKAGVIAGDLITEVQGLVVAGAKGDDVKAAMQKLVGETLRLKIKHANSDPVEVLMTAALRP